MTSEADEYEALWRKAFEEYLRHPDSIDASNQAAASILRDHVEAKLAEVLPGFIFYRNGYADRCADLADRDRTIAEQAAELADMKERGAQLVIAYHIAICSPKGVVPMDQFYDPTIAAKVERECAIARAALGGSNAK